MQARSTMILPTQKRSADGRIGRSPIPDPSRARRRGTGSCAARADTPWSAWRGPGSSAGSLTVPEKRAVLPERACPERARRRLILDRARSVALPAASSFTPSPGRGSPASPAPRPGARAPRPGVRPVRTLTRAGTPLPGLGPGAFVRIPGCTPPPPAATVPRGAHPPDPAILPSLSNQARPRSPYSPEFDPHAPRRPAAHRPRPTGAANTPHQPGCTPPPPPTSTRRVRSAQYFHAYP